MKPAGRSRRAEPAFWDLYATVYDAIWAWPLGFVPWTVLQPLLTGGPGTAADLGCGTGVAAATLADRGWRVVGLDTSAAMLRRASARTGRVAWVRADAATPVLAPAAFDVVLVLMVLHVHPRPAAVVQAAMRAVRPGGIVLFSVPDDAVTLAELARAERRLGRRAGATLMAAALRTAVGAAGAALRVRRHDHTALLGLVDQQARTMACDVTVTPLEGGQWVAVVRRPARPCCLTRI